VRGQFGSESLEQRCAFGAVALCLEQLIGQRALGFVADA